MSTVSLNPWRSSECLLRRSRILVGPLALWVLTACSNTPDVPDVPDPEAGPATMGGPSPRGDAGQPEASGSCDPNNPFCGPAVEAPSEDPECKSLGIDPQAAGVNIMLAIDGSKSMEKHWSKIEAAIRSLRLSNPEAAFGVQQFWSDSVEGAGILDPLNGTNNACVEMHQDVLELGDHDADAMIGFLAEGPRGGVLFDIYQTASIIEPLSLYVSDDTHALADSGRTNYLIVFTHGNDNCFGSAFARTTEKLLAYKKIAVELARKNIRVVPVALDAPSESEPMAGPFGGGPGFIGANYMETTTDFAVLKTLLDNGGSGLEEVPRIDTEEQVEQLVASLGQSFRTCRFKLPTEFDSSESINPFEVAFNINGRRVKRDRGRENGWDFVHGTSEVEFFGQGCEAIQAGEELETQRSCDEDVCATAVVQASTRPRAVLLLLDSSQSRTECSDGSLDCTFGGLNDPDRPPSYWEVVQRAVSEVLVAPVNDEVMFGMQFFPFKEAADLSCEVAAEPEIPPAVGQQISIMQAMLEKRPNGLSPVVGVMESVASNPGILADPGVIGSVVLLTEDGDNCTGEELPDMVARLGTAAQRLLADDVRTFVVRYGSEEGKTPQQIEQLSAVAENGGEARVDAEVPYLEAKSPEEFLEALNGISEQLATCAFELGELDPSADKDRTNLFMNGKQVGFDAPGTKQEGWGWVDQERFGIELYGESCAEFKAQRNTHLSVEFGCELVVVI